MIVPRPRSLFAAAIACGAALCTSSTVARADIYMTRGPDGSMHFTNIPSQRGSNAVVVVRSRDSAPSSRSPSQVITATGDGRDANGAAANLQTAYVRTLYEATARDASRYGRYDGFIREAAALYQLPEALLRAVIKQESDYNPYSVSGSGAAGLMQLMPSTAESMMVRDVFDPRQSILGGTRFLRILANMFNGDLVLTIAAYNAGPNAVIRYAGVPPYEETQNYVRQVLRYYYLYRAGQMPGMETPANAVGANANAAPAVTRAALAP
jgi:soluble lytic murein transglycosylase-like protein